MPKFTPCSDECLGFSMIDNDGQFEIQCCDQCVANGSPIKTDELAVYALGLYSYKAKVQTSGITSAGLILDVLWPWKGASYPLDEDQRAVYRHILKASDDRYTKG